MPYPSRTGFPTLSLHVRVDAQERAELESYAADAGITLGELIRRRALFKPVQHKSDKLAIAQLRSLAGLIKNLHNEGLGFENETANAVRSLTQAAQNLAAKS